MVRVHEAEKSIAKYPRVVIDPALMRLLPDQIHQYPLPPDPFLKKDRVDGHYFLNYYHALILNEDKIWYQLLSGVTQIIITSFAKANQDIFPKLYWLVKYHNNFCRKTHCDEFIIPQHFIVQKQREIMRLSKKTLILPTNSGVI